MNGSEEECIQDICGKVKRKVTIRKTKTQIVDNIKMDLKDRMRLYGLD
jgi:hypothetical protein